MTVFTWYYFIPSLSPYEVHAKGTTRGEGRHFLWSSHLLSRSRQMSHLSDVSAILLHVCSPQEAIDGEIWQFHSMCAKYLYMPAINGPKHPRHERVADSTMLGNSTQSSGVHLCLPCTSIAQSPTSTNDAVVVLIPVIVPVSASFLVSEADALQT